MILIFKGHDFFYEMENMARLFFPGVKFTVAGAMPETAEQNAARLAVCLSCAGGGAVCRCLCWRSV